MSHRCDGRDLSCRRCAEIASRLETVRAAMTFDDQLDDIKRARIWAQLEDRLGDPAPRRPRWPVAIGFAAVAAAVAAATIAVIPRPRTAAPPQVLSAAAETTVSSRIGPHTQAALVGPAQLELIGRAGDATAVRLRSGTLLAEFAGGANRRLRVEAPGALVEVVGTLFAVEVRGTDTCTSVAYGRVRVTSTAGVVHVAGGEQYCTGGAVRPIASEMREALERHQAAIAVRAMPSDPVATRDPHGRAAVSDAPATHDPAAVAVPATHDPAAIAAVPATRDPVAIADAPASHAPAAAEAPAAVVDARAPHAPAAVVDARAPHAPAAVVDGRAPHASAAVANAPVPHAPAAVVDGRAPHAPAAVVDGRAPRAPAAAANAPVPSAPAAAANAPVPSAPAAAANAPVSHAPPAANAPVPHAPAAPRPGDPAPPTADELYRAAETSLAARNPAAADRALATLIAEHPGSPLVDQALYERARIAYQQHAWANARRHLDRLAAIRSTPLAEPGHYLTCRIAVEARDAEAATCLADYRQSFPRSPHDLEALALLVQLAHARDGCPPAAGLIAELVRTYPRTTLAAAWHTRCPKPR